MTINTRSSIADTLRASNSTRSDPDIARQYDVDVSTVRHIRLRLGIPAYRGRGVRGDAIDWSRADWSLPVLEIAERLGCNVETVRHRRCREGRQRWRRRRWTAEEDAAVLAQAGRDVQLAATLGRSVTAVGQRRSVLRRLRGTA